MYNSIFIDEFSQQAKRTALAIVDVRELAEFQNGHIPTAQNLPLSSLTTTYQKLDKETPYYIICHAGGRSAQASDFLAQQGYDVTNVMGGMSAWKGSLE
ncbi:MAG: rhodanese-like domain-containing protein [Enterococcus sp.]